MDARTQAQALGLFYAHHVIRQNSQSNKTSSWAFYQGSYGCGSEQGQGCDNCSLADAEKACTGWKAMYVDAPPGKMPVPGQTYSYSCCNQMYGPTVKPVQNAFYCSGPGTTFESACL